MTTVSGAGAPAQQELSEDPGAHEATPPTPAAPASERARRSTTPTATPPPDPDAGSGPWHRTLQVLMWSTVVAVVLAVAWGVYRNNRLAGGGVLVAAHVALLAVAWLDGWSLRARSDRQWNIWIPRVCYPLGLLLGVVVAIDSSNLFPRLLGLAVLLGVHAVAAAAVATIVGHFLHGGTSLTRPWQLVVSIVIAGCSIVLAAVLDAEAVYRNLDLSTSWYVVLVLATVAAAAFVSLRRMREDQNPEAAERVVPGRLLLRRRRRRRARHHPRADGLLAQQRPRRRTTDPRAAGHQRHLG